MEVEIDVAAEAEEVEEAIDEAVVDEATEAAETGTSKLIMMMSGLTFGCFCRNSARYYFFIFLS